MAAQGTRKRFALDSNLLMDLAGGEDYAHTFLEEFQQRGDTVLTVLNSSVGRENNTSLLPSSDISSRHPRPASQKSFR
jgi:hypothetical protein